MAYISCHTKWEYKLCVFSCVFVCLTLWVWCYMGVRLLAYFHGYIHGHRHGYIHGYNIFHAYIHGYIHGYSHGYIVFCQCRDSTPRCSGINHYFLTSLNTVYPPPPSQPPKWVVTFLYQMCVCVHVCVRACVRACARVCVSRLFLFVLLGSLGVLACRQTAPIKEGGMSCLIIACTLLEGVTAYYKYTLYMDTCWICVGTR